MPNRIFVTFQKTSENAVVGESTVKGLEGAIEARSLSWGGAQNLSIGASGFSAGKVEFHEIHFTKALDKASPSLFLALCAGRTYPQVDITFRRTSGGDLMEVAHLQLRTVGVSSIEGSGADDTPVEDVGLTYGSVLWQVGQVDEGNSAKGWDRVKNRPL
jgi:type VI secretion system secreted protein Hcp